MASSSGLRSSLRRQFVIRPEGRVLRIDLDHTLAAHPWGISSKHWSGTAATASAEGAFQRGRNLFGSLYPNGPLGYRRGHGDDVGLLESQLPDGACTFLFVAIDLTRDENSGAGIEIATPNSRQEISRAWTACRHCDAGYARHSSTGIGSESSGLFVVNADDL